MHSLAEDQPVPAQRAGALDTPCPHCGGELSFDDAIKVMNRRRAAAMFAALQTMSDRAGLVDATTAEIADEAGITDRGHARRAMQLLRLAGLISVTERPGQPNLIQVGDAR